MAEGENPMQLPRVKFRPDFQIGQGVNLIAMLTLIYTVSNGFANLITTMVTERTEMKQQITQLVADRAKYVPMIEAVHNSDSVQKLQIQNIADNVQELKTSQQTLSITVTSAIGSLQSDLAIIKARSENGVKIR